jgi:N-acyl-L-homoserine lactone synthetase
MILVIDALNQDRFADVLDEMFQLRARVFGGRLGWEVQVNNGREYDQFDDLDPAYVIGLDIEGQLVSCARFLQTTGPHMLSDVFHAILDGQPPLRSATLWESTRFCVDTERLSAGVQVGGVARATSEIMIGMLEYARNSGVTDIITVIDPIMNRVMKRSANAPYDYVGKVADMGKVSAMAALIDCTDERIDRLRAFSGILDAVFISDDAARALIDARAKPAKVQPAMDIAQADIVSYCRAQLDAAETEEERRAAQRLVAHLVEQGLHPAQ